MKMKCDRCGLADESVAHHSASGINLHGKCPDHEQAARELITFLRVSDWTGEKTERVLAALAAAEAKGRAAAFEQLAKALRESFYTQRDEKAPGVWLFSKLRDEKGEEWIQDDRLFPRHADAQKQIDAFVNAVMDSARAGAKHE